MKTALKIIDSPVTASLLIALSVSFLIIALRNRGCLEFLELSSYDQYIRFYSRSNGPDPRIVLVTISETDIQRLGKWPLPDSSLASILELLVSYKPRAIGLDIYRDIPVPPGEKQLRAVFAGHNHIVTVKKIGDENSPGISAPYMLRDSNPVGFNDILVDTGGIVRRGLLFLDDKEDIIPSFSLILTLLYLKQEGIHPRPGEKDPQHLRLGKTTFIPFESNDGGYVRADARGYQFLLDFRNGWIPFHNTPLRELISGEADPDIFEGGIIIVGAAAESLHDLFYTPLSRGRGSHQRMYGVELHAHMVNQLIRSALEENKPIQSLSYWYEWAWVLLWGLLGGILSLWRPTLHRSILMMLSGLIFMVSITFFLFVSGWWIPVVPPILAWFTSGALSNTFLSHREKVQKASLMALFSRHVSEDVANALWQQKDQFMDGRRPRAQRLFATVLFTDLKGFTSISEKLDPETLMNWLNEYMGAMSQIVNMHRGVVNKYMGDGMMAVFGVPVARTERAEISRDVLNAVNCAMTMSAELKRLNIQWQSRNLPHTRMRIGIFTGPLVAGCLGGNLRMEYTVIGDTVNIASRLESYHKEGTDFDIEESCCRIFIGESTLNYLDNRIETEMIGSTILKGKREPITIHRVVRKKGADGDRPF
ncbi:MAG: CHASE2 domain-containing protein [bacterium]